MAVYIHDETARMYQVGILTPTFDMEQNIFIIISVFSVHTRRAMIDKYVNLSFEAFREENYSQIYR
jgi:hypothetical protein